MSRKVHACGRLCSQGVETESGMVCALTGMVTAAQKFVHSVSFSSGRGKCTNTPIVHWGYGTRVRRTRKTTSRLKHAAAMTESAIARMVTAIFCSKPREQIYAHNVLRRTRNMNKTIKEFAADGRIPIQAMMQQTLRIRQATIRVAPVNKCITDASKSIFLYWKTNRWLSETGSAHNVTACLINFLSHGMHVRGVCMFPIVPWIRRFAPSDTEYGGLAGVQCRAMSATSRLIKGNLVTSMGTPLADKAFRFVLSPELRGDTSLI